MTIAGLPLIANNYDTRFRARARARAEEAGKEQARTPMLRRWEAEDELGADASTVREPIHALGVSIAT